MYYRSKSAIQGQVLGMAENHKNQQHTLMKAILSNGLLKLTPFAVAATLMFGTIACNNQAEAPVEEAPADSMVVDSAAVDSAAADTAAADSAAAN